ncbi:Bor family protein [Actinobacillus equuli subsp. haemolyticus]|nr:Bor family protein [Actinobacillus equuli subsp. haemolyticus]
MMKKLFSIIAVCSLAACSTQTLEIAPAKEAQYDRVQDFFVGGLAQKQEINAAEICGGASKVGKVETETTFFNGLLGMVTYGIYSPRQIRVYCN